MEDIARAEALMEKLYAAGAPDRAIARVLDVPISQVIRWRIGRGLSVQATAYQYGLTAGKGRVALSWEAMTPLRLAKKGAEQDATTRQD